MPIFFLHLILFVITTTVTNLIPPVHSNYTANQKQSLLHFSNSLKFHYGNFQSQKIITWDPSTDYCSWLGVTCSTNGCVVGLDLSDEDISCGIDNSSSLFQLQHLQSLNLAHNDFNASSIPSAIGKLNELRYLNLSDAYFSGDIPIEIARLTRLVSLDLSGNHNALKLENLNLISRNLTKLEELRLGRVQLSAQGNDVDWCEAISSSLPNLRVLSLSGCGLTSPICESLAKLQSLYEIDLSRNSFSAPVPRVLANFSNLISLNLEMSGLLGIFPNEIFQKPTLQSVNLSSNPKLQGSLPEFSSNNGSLESLVLSGTDFSGVLPDSVGNLKLLSKLDLSCCNFTGAVPPSLVNLTQLEFLALSSNKFSSIDSIQWDKLIKLKHLDLAHNLLHGGIPMSLFCMPLVRRLLLSGNHFSGQLPEFSNVTSYLLYELDLGSNYLEGSIPMSVFNLSKLDQLDLSSNNLSGFPFYGLEKPRTLSFLDLSHNNLLFKHNFTNTSPAFLLQIQDLNLASNNLTAFPSFLKNQSDLASLDLSDNHIPGQIPNWIWKSPLNTLNLCCNKLVSLEAPLADFTYSLLKLDLHSNRLHGHIPLFVSGEYMDYSRNNFSSRIPIDIGYFLPFTLFFSLSSNNLHGIIPRSICDTSGLVLDLSNNSLSGIIPQCLTQQIGMLSVLDLRRNKLTGSIPDTFPKGCTLETLSLGRNQMQGQFPKSLANCSRLKFLDLGINQITDTFPCQLKSISTLSVLLLRSNQFYGHIGCLKSNSTWPELKVIDLAHNNFSGEIPGMLLSTWQAMMVILEQDNSPIYLKYEWIYDAGGFEYSINYGDAITTTSKGLEIDLVKMLTIFTSIDFSANNFSGKIPEEMGQLRSLYVLNLSNNAFTGKIPSSFGNMGSIESLDLSHNHLSGQIPLQLANLTFLSYLNVSNNQLTGRIPTSTQFSTFPSTSFGGNKGLWGPPLTMLPPPLPPPPAASNGFHSNLGDEIDWDVLSVEIGFTFGFGLAVCSLLFCKGWRKWYYRAMFNILVKIFPQLEHRFGNHRRHVHVNQRFWRR